VTGRPAIGPKEKGKMKTAPFYLVIENEWLGGKPYKIVYTCESFEEACKVAEGRARLKTPEEKTGYYVSAPIVWYERSETTRTAFRVPQEDCI
jgi:hypothetical protein